MTVFVFCYPDQKINVTTIRSQPIPLFHQVHIAQVHFLSVASIRLLLLPKLVHRLWLEELEGR